MGTLAAIIPVVGLFAGMIIARYSELRNWKPQKKIPSEIIPFLSVVAVLAPKTQVLLFLFLMFLGTMYYKEGKKLFLCMIIYVLLIFISTIKF